MSEESSLVEIAQLRGKLTDKIDELNDALHWNRRWKALLIGYVLASFVFVVAPSVFTDYEERKKDVEEIQGHVNAVHESLEAVDHSVKEDKLDAILEKLLVNNGLLNENQSLILTKAETAQEKITQLEKAVEHLIGHTNDSVTNDDPSKPNIEAETETE